MKFYVLFQFCFLTSQMFVKKLSLLSCIVLFAFISTKICSFVSSAMFSTFVSTSTIPLLPVYHSQLSRRFMIHNRKPALPRYWGDDWRLSSYCCACFSSFRCRNSCTCSVCISFLLLIYAHTLFHVYPYLIASSVVLRTSSMWFIYFSQFATITVNLLHFITFALLFLWLLFNSYHYIFYEQIR